MKKTVMMMLFSLACTVMYAQERSITGVLTDRDTKETLAQVFTDIRYTRENNELFSKIYLDFIVEQGFKMPE